MVKQKVIVTNPSGLHLTTAAILSNFAMKYHCSVEFEYEDEEKGYGLANMKSLLNTVGAMVVQGQEITVICTGTDEDEALRSIVHKIEGGIRE